MTEKETKPTKTLGQAIDEIIRALQTIDQNNRITAIRTTCEHFNISLEKVPGGPPSSEPHISRESIASAQLIDIKSFREEKKPSSANEMAAVVAFYISELAPKNNRKTEVDVHDMNKYFKQAGFLLPQSTAQLLVNAKNAGYLDPAGGGKYKLNPVGYNLVAHNLPRRTQTSAKPRQKQKVIKKKS